MIEKSGKMSFFLQKDQIFLSMVTFLVFLTILNNSYKKGFIFSKYKSYLNLLFNLKTIFSASHLGYKHQNHPKINIILS